jgi:hypothetical protein
MLHRYFAQLAFILHGIAWHSIGRFDSFMYRFFLPLDELGGQKVHFLVRAVGELAGLAVSVRSARRGHFSSWWRGREDGLIWPE